MKRTMQNSNNETDFMNYRRVGGCWLWELEVGDVRRSGWKDTKTEAAQAVRAALHELEANETLAE